MNLDRFVTSAAVSSIIVELAAVAEIAVYGSARSTLLDYVLSTVVMFVGYNVGYAGANFWRTRRGN